MKRKRQSSILSEPKANAIPFCYRDEASQTTRESLEQHDTTSSSNISRPLTAANLRLHLHLLKNSNSTTPSGSGSAIKVSNPSTAGSPKSTYPASIKLSTNGGDIHEVLFVHHMIIGDPAAAKRASALIDKVTELVKGTRSSTMKSTSVNKFLDERDHLSMANEQTFVHMLLNRIKKDDRLVKSSYESNPPDVFVEELREWKDDYLDMNLDVEFRQESLVAVTLSDNPAIERVKNPRPNVAFGLMRKALTMEQRETSNIYKTYTEGSLQEAVTHSCRSGTVMVYAMRELYAILGTETKEGVDGASFAFSICLTPDLAQLFLHWAEVVQGTVEYNMQRIGNYVLDDKDNVKELRRDMDNILDWGVFERKRVLCETLDAIRATMPPPGKKRKTG